MKNISMICYNMQRETRRKNMLTQKEQKKNILFGYLYIAAGFIFLAIMAVIFATDGIETDTREYVVMALVLLIGLGVIFSGTRQIKDNKTLIEGIPKQMLEETLSEMSLFKSLDLSVRDITRHMTEETEKYFIKNPILDQADDVRQALYKKKGRPI